MQSYKENNNILTFGFRPYQFLASAVQGLVSCGDSMLLACVCSISTKLFITVMSVSLSSAGACIMGSIPVVVTGGSIIPVASPRAAVTHLRHPVDSVHSCAAVQLSDAGLHNGKYIVVRGQPGLVA